MSFRRGLGWSAVALTVAAVLAGGAAVAAPLPASMRASGQAPKQPAKPGPAEKQQQELLQSLVKYADDAMTGQPLPADVPLQFQPDFLKAQENRTYVPFILTVDASKLTSPSVALYIRVAAKGTTAPTPPPAPASEKDKKDKRDKDKKADAKDVPSMPTNYAFEDVHYLEVAPAAAGQPARVSRAFAVPAGDYDVYLVLRERNPPPSAAPKASVLKQTVTVPNFWTNDLTTSSVILADRVDTLSAPLSREQQIEHPYAIGQSDIQVAADAKFRKSEELSVVFLIYNPAIGSDKSFNLQVDYAFYRRTPDGEKYFNRTEPQKFTPAVLGPQVDLSAGHQLVAGQAVPLAGFPEGDYRLEIKVTDLVSGQSLTRDVAFTVTS